MNTTVHQSLGDTIRALRYVLKRYWTVYNRSRWWLTNRASPTGLIVSIEIATTVDLDTGRTYLNRFVTQTRLAPFTGCVICTILKFKRLQWRQPRLGYTPHSISTRVFEYVVSLYNDLRWPADGQVNVLPFSDRSLTNSLAPKGWKDWWDPCRTWTMGLGVSATNDASYGCAILFHSNDYIRSK